MVKEIKKTQLNPGQVEQKSKEKVIFSLPSTYSLVTAERLLAKFGLHLSQNSISKQIQNPQTVYHALMFLPAKRLNINVNIERCRDIQAFGQQKLIHYLFSGEASKPETDPGQNVREDVEQNRQKMVELGKEFASWEEGCKEREKTLVDSLQEKVLAWQHTVSEVVNELINCLYSNNIEVEQNFADQAFINILESSVKLELKQQQIEQYGCPQPLGIIERTVIYLITDSVLADKLNSSSLKKMRTEFKILDDKLKIHFDDLTGINSEGKVEIESDLKFIEELSTRLEEHVVNLTKKLFDYYSEYSSEKSLKVGASEALELGVDSTVADDYRALQM